jgi:predicted exporter
MIDLRRWLPVLIAAMWLAAMVQIIVSQLSLSNDVSKFLSDSRDARLAWISNQLAESEQTKTTILVVGAQSGDRDRTLAAADALASTLAADDEVARVRLGWDASLRQAIDELYFPRRFQFAAEDPTTLGERLSDAGLERTASELAEQLRAPSSERLAEQLAEQLARDPLLAHRAQARRIGQARPAPIDEGDGGDEGRFVTEDGRAVVFVTTVHSPFDFDSQRPLQHAITERFAELDREAQAAGDDLTLIQSGVARFALEAESQIRSDIRRISTISLIGVIALFLLLFRSVWMLVLSMLPLLAGFLTATGLSLLVFEQLHVLTLVFGASLIGVCIDYPIHLFTHHALYHDSEHRNVVAGVRPGLLLGALTTMAGFVGMGWAAFPGIREISAFASLGILAALATTLWVLPVLLPKSTQLARPQQWVMAGAAHVMKSMAGSRRVLSVMLLGAMVIMAIGLPQLEYQDDVSVLTESSAELLAEEEEIRSLVSRMDVGRAIVVFGADDEEALTRNEEVHRRLVEAEAAGELTGFRSIHNFSLSASVQTANFAHVCAREQLPAALERAYARHGLPVDYARFATEFVELCGAKPKVLEWPMLADSALGPVVAPLRFEYGRQTALVTYVSGVEDMRNIQARMAGAEGVIVFDQRALMTELFGRQRSQATELVGFGLLAVLVILFARHGELRSTLAAFTPSILAAGTTLALLALFNQSLTLMHVIGLVLVLSMGVDYGVFLTESRGDRREVAATIFSLMACCTSTVLSIGLLGLSSNPGLQALGVTTGIGVLLSLILAPTALVLLSGQKVKRLNGSSSASSQLSSRPPM